ncbi:hypothetical protein LIER_16256 [Lithospermum erythrorhizon]|uniref:Uncharacterized protein n=1 Tax=Lithospermum erythrorhizon TaxID=34254 RepID=A0AAV3Q8I6_LITER
MGNYLSHKSYEISTNEFGNARRWVYLSEEEGPQRYVTDPEIDKKASTFIARFHQVQEYSLSTDECLSPPSKKWLPSTTTLFRSIR